MPNSELTGARGGTGILFEFLKVLRLDFFIFSESECIFIAVEVFTAVADHAVQINVRSIVGIRDPAEVCISGCSAM